jgi:hypothetical protein
MLDRADFKIVNRYKKKYRCYCNSCSADRGYIYEDGLGICYSCAKEHRNKNAGYGSSGNPTNIDGTNYYSATCITCGIDRGLKQKTHIYKNCNSCSASKNNQKRFAKTKIDETHKKLRHVIRSGINRKLKLRNASKGGRSLLKILPYSINELKTHLELRFQPGMTWKNRGQWEIDHIIPDSSFTYSKISDDGFLKSWSLDNLQPLWKEENRRKSNSILNGRLDE